MALPDPAEFSLKELEQQRTMFDSHAEANIRNDINKILMDVTNFINKIQALRSAQKDYIQQLKSRFRRIL